MTDVRSPRDTTISHETRTVTRSNLTKPEGNPYEEGVVQAGATRGMPADTFPRNWIKFDTFPLYAGFLGWTIPSCIPVSGFGGSSLFGEFLGSIGSNLSQFPKGPGLDDTFWLYLTVYHVGLFTTLTLAKIGYEGRKEGYFGSKTVGGPPPPAAEETAPADE